MSIVIFGVNGQDGYYMSKIFKKRNIEVYGVSRKPGNWLTGDVANPEFVENLIKSIKPEYIFHFAANSSTKHEFLFENHETISTGTLNILESVKKHSPESKVFITGSGVQFRNEGKPIKETDEFEANSPYSIARIQSVYAARYYRNLGIKTYVGYLFHHESPLRKPVHLSKYVIETVKDIQIGKNVRLKIGDLTVMKEWNYAKDIAEGIFSLIKQENIYEAVIGSGEVHTIEEWVETCFNLIGKDWKKFTDLNNIYKPEYKILVSDPGTIKSIGWEPETNFQMLARIMFENILS
jgi:GDPmannose 4,6-dehydratase